ncbi:hypothetical protein [Moorena sp. SIO4G3]|uniref:hypothetical protein n=1 Tax=Moorena sp. SIO4G3 TaxID=2607821 RepID=UPI00142A3612|nr:hypothetical protein [Moorena sp. SIO4G3]NEO80030.1 hypothetical protein [Moorena sp. SIO4G3]
MEILTIIQGFTQALKTDYEKFKIEDLQDLDQVLAALDTPTEDELNELIKTWLKKHKQVRDAVLPFAQTTQELKKSPKLPPNSEAGILENLFELRQTNQKVIKAKTNQQDQDKSQQ